MSRHRDRQADLAETRRLQMNTYLQSRISDTKKNWLGHTTGSGAANIDALLLVGATMDELNRCRGAVGEHLMHLRDEHGLAVSNRDGIYRFEFRDKAAVECKGHGETNADLPRTVVSRRPADGGSKVPVNARHVVKEIAPSSIDVAYAEHAERVFMQPTVCYSWDEIVNGVPVQSAGGTTKRMWAVAPNTFRGFHLIDKSQPGARDVFHTYFMRQRPQIVGALSRIATWEELHNCANRLCDEIRPLLSNIKPHMLLSYNKIRKPVDLYLEHLVAMGRELDGPRKTLVPLLYLPLDSQIMANSAILSDVQLAAHGLNRASTYGEVQEEANYIALQKCIRERAHSVGRDLALSFHAIYFDLVWSGRWRSKGGNLFMTNPG